MQIHGAIRQRCQRRTPEINPPSHEVSAKVLPDPRYQQDDDHDPEAEVSIGIELHSDAQHCIRFASRVGACTTLPDRPLPHEG
jgi:hypothetical protein